MSGKSAICLERLPGGRILRSLDCYGRLFFASSCGKGGTNTIMNIETPDQYDSMSFQKLNMPSLFFALSLAPPL